MLRQHTARPDADGTSNGCCFRTIFAAGAGVATIGARLMKRDQMFFPVPDQVRATHVFERFTQQRPVIWIVVAQERFM